MKFFETISSAKKRYKFIEKKQNGYLLFSAVVLVCIWWRLGFEHISPLENLSKPGKKGQFPRFFSLSADFVFNRLSPVCGRRSKNINEDGSVSR